jgi:hypothetical protein
VRQLAAARGGPPFDHSRLAPLKAGVNLLQVLLGMLKVRIQLQRLYKTLAGGWQLLILRQQHA